jgi:uncharacterized protein YycO
VIQLRFFGGSGISSRAIEWFSGGYFSHVAAIWSETELLDSRSDIVAGVPSGVERRPIAAEKASIMVTMELPTTPLQTIAWRNFLASQIGKPYDKPAIWGFAFNRDWREPDSWFCSELQAAALEKASICPQLYAPNNKITPVALATILSALGASIVTA